MTQLDSNTRASTHTGNRIEGGGCKWHRTHSEGGGLFTEGRWRKQPNAEVLALNTYIKRHLRL